MRSQTLLRVPYRSAAIFLAAVLKVIVHFISIKPPTYANDRPKRKRCAPLIEAAETTRTSKSKTPGSVILTRSTSLAPRLQRFGAGVVRKQ